MGANPTTHLFLFYRRPKGQAMVATKQQPEAHIDFETRSVVDLRVVGVWKYASHPLTSVNCMAWAIGDDPVEIWSRGDKFPSELLDCIKNGGLVWAWNAQFERLIWKLCQAPRLGWPTVPFERWRCSAAQSAYSNHPRKLASAVQLLAPDMAGKDKSAVNLMRKMAVPRRRTKKDGDTPGVLWVEDPISMAILEAYCIQDVEIERHVGKLLHDWPEDEIRVWQINERINDRGVPFDRDLCEAAVDVLRQSNEMICKNISEKTATEEHPEGEITTGNQIQRIKKFLAARGVMDEDESLDADAVEDFLGAELDDDCRDILMMRQIASGAAAKKYKSAIDVMDTDDRGRCLFMYYGASATGRFTSMKTQIQNMKKGGDKTNLFHDTVLLRDLGAMHMIYGNDTISELGKNVRSLVCPPEGKLLVRCDSSQNECRVLHWLADNENMLSTFREGADPYIKLAAEVFNRQIVKGDPERQIGKFAVLGLGFGMGPARFQTMVKVQGGEHITLKFGKRVVDVYRSGNPAVTKFWATLEKAAMASVQRKMAIRVGRLVIRTSGDYMRIVLPSGRELFYYKPEFVKEGRGMRFMYTSTYGVRYEWAGGLLCENCVQAVARDTLVHYMKLAVDRGLDIVAHIHDEIMCEASEEDAERVKDVLLDCFATPLPWMKGLPCAAEAKIGRRYG